MRAYRLPLCLIIRQQLVSYGHRRARCISCVVTQREALMLIFGSLLMSSVIATTPATPLPWFNLNDYPTKAFEREWQGTTNFDVIVDPQGRSTDCRIAK